MDQLRTVMQEMSERFSVRHTASAWSRSRPAKRARNSFRSPLATTGSVNGSALPSRPRAWLRAASMRCRASLSLSSAPTWMIQPVWARRGLDGAVLLDGLRLARAPDRHRPAPASRRRRRHARCRQHAEHAVAGAEIGRLRRHLGRAALAVGRFGLDSALGHDGAGGLRHFRDGPAVLRW